MISRIVIGLLLGIGCTLYHLHYDPWAQKKVESILLASLSEIFNCNVSGSVQYWNVVQPCMRIKNLTMAARDGSWRWSAKKYASFFSWHDVFTTGVMPLHMRLEELEGVSSMHGSVPAVAPHINDLMKGPDLPIPVIMMGADIAKATLRIVDDKFELETNWRCKARRVGATFRSHFRFSNGTLSKQKKLLAQHISGTMGVDATQKDVQSAVQYDLKTNMQCHLAQLGEYPLCTIQGSWGKNGLRVQLESADKSLRLNPLVITQEGDDWQIRAQAAMPASFLYTMMTQKDDALLQGSCAIQLKGSLAEDGDLDGCIICEDFYHPWLSNTTIFNSLFSKVNKKITSNWHIKNGEHGLAGSFYWDIEQQKGTFSGTNESSIASAVVPFWRINPQEIRFDFDYDALAHQGTGSYVCTLQHVLDEKEVKIQGTQLLNADSVISSHGSISNYTYGITGTSAYPYLSEWYLKKEDTCLAQCHYEKPNNGYAVAIDFSLLKELVFLSWHYELFGEGILKGKGRIEPDFISLGLSFEKATIRLPQTYNFLSNASLELQWYHAQKKLQYQNLQATLHSGSLWSPAGRCFFDKEWSPTFVHAPFFIDRCLVSAKKDLFAVASGNFLLTKNQKNPFHLHGSLIINRAQLKENIFSEQVQKKLFSSTERELPQWPITCDVTVETKEPIRIDTPFLKANSQVALHASGSLHAPVLEGMICVPTGTIGFPYKPLEITKGELRFVKEQPLNPLVEVIAKNNIKNHHLTLNVTGSLQDTMVLLESTPPLSQEQIVGLLMAGAHEDSLDALIPAMLMKNVTNYIVSSHQSNFFDRFIKPWMRQVNVHLKPQLSDQSGRGGLRGALEIVLNERWRALIEKNFTLTEDTHFELEYILSDDVTFRMIRDERRDIGGEVEMKWKF